MKWSFVVLIVAFAGAVVIVMHAMGEWHRYIWQDPCNLPIPPELAEPADSIREHYAKRVFKAEWGGPDKDGPDRCLPDTCFWLHGVLHCRSII